ncbi:Adenosine (5')-pentaphospho-(5'')-adenosine pyrophosphohydrolase [hydrothermal vent metagenome]|uniref:Adenosine (5')-pentaphospho-(5'')-adenosine pyrophosphohydrolase n=1 Tax=hydrothermal vent metagenome TaxID=652676 RepID=A0A3B1AB87_9ZZZZ
MSHKTQIIDKHGYRHNVGIILCNNKDQLLWARRIGENAWQFPQGGIRADESLEMALFRELNEEIGLSSNDVEVIGSTNNWLHYKLPKQFVDHDRKPVCIGQKQIWFMLRLTADEKKLCLTKSSKPEFDGWCWINYWEPINQVVSFKQGVYKLALKELEPALYLDNTQSHCIAAVND